MDLSIEGGLCWSAPLTLVSWAGYQSRYGPYGAVDSTTPSDGSVTLVFAPEGRGTEALTRAELGLIAWFEMHEPSVSEAVKAAILAWCAPDNAARLRDFDFDDSFPRVKSQDDLRGLVGLHTVFVHQIETGGAPYIGYEFGCEWDVEHDLGVLMRRDGTDRGGTGRYRLPALDREGGLGEKGETPGADPTHDGRSAASIAAIKAACSAGSLTRRRNQSSGPRRSANRPLGSSWKCSQALPFR
jgi:hypothetical protein